MSTPTALATRRHIHAAEGDARLGGRALILARAGWIAVASVVLALGLIGTSAEYHQMQAACMGSTCLAHQPTPDDLRALLRAHVSLPFFARVQVALSWVGILVYMALAAVIFWRRSDNRLALFGAYMLVIFGAGTVFGPLNALPASDARWSLPVNLIINAGPPAFYAFFCLFPSGHFAPPWMRWVALAWLLGEAASAVPYPPLQALAGTLPLFTIFFGLLVFTQVYRYRAVSTPRQREQTKWVVFGFAAGMGGFLTLLGVSDLGVPGASSAVEIFVVSAAMDALLYVIPLSIGLAILRSRLWDIDVIINRTLVYGSLTAFLAGVYFCSVLLMQHLAIALAGSSAGSNPLILVLSTLLIAALFQPLRIRLQHTIDRRFYRQKYDAAKTLESFAATLRGEVDLADLERHLLEVVEETVQPEHVSVWLRREEGMR